LTVGETVHVGPLSPGLYSASAMVRSRGMGIGLEGREISITVGETALIRFDLRESMFGRLVLRVRTGDRGPIAAGVRVLRVQGNEWGVTGQTLDPNGGTILGGVAPGIVQLEVHARDESWSWTDPRSIELAPGQERELVIDVPWIERAIVVRDGNGAPLARTELEFGLGEPAQQSGTGWSSLRTDDAGRATIALPPGIARLRFANGATHTIAWSADLPDEVAVVEGV
jgi:hypothetical protein